MVDSDFDGTLILERLSAIGRLEEYADAVDADDFEAVTSLLRLAGFDPETVALVIAAMADA